MVNTPHVRFFLPDRSYQAVVRAELRKFAEQAGFTASRLAEIEIIIAEITSNIVKYAAKGGEILARKYPGLGKGIELIAIDDGPGISRPLKMMEDGQTSGSSLGQGLGAIRRLSDVFDMYSLVDWGTIIYSRIFVDKKYTIPAAKFNLSAISIPKKGEVVCGDAWCWIVKGKRNIISVVDGLGHGPHAHVAAERAVETLSHHLELRPTEQIRAMHTELKKTRGAVITTAVVDELNNQVSYAGVGNISMKILSPGRVHTCNAYNGIVGHIMPTALNEHHRSWDKKNDLLVMHSDGLSARWDIGKYPRILQHHDLILCAALLKDVGRGNDDSTVLVARSTK